MSETRQQSARCRGRLDGMELDFERCYRAVDSRDQRFDGYRTGQLRRCPGAASQPAADGSSPWRDASGALDCDPTQVPPGP